MKYKKSYLLGLTLVGTINSIKDFGELGNDILKELRIKKIDPNKFYHFKLRSSIHDRVYKEFGAKGLFYAGFINQDNWIDSNKEWRNTNISFIKVFSKLKTKKSILDKLANNVFKNFIGKGLEMATKGPVKFGFHSANFNKNKLKVKLIMASRLNHANFLAGTMDNLLCRIFEKKYTFNINCNLKESEEFDEYVLFCFDIEIISDKSEINTISSKRQRLKDDLFAETLTNINRERKKVKKITSELSKYIPPQIHDALFAGKYDTEIKTQRRKLTVFFSDIRNFTSTSENLQPEDLTKYLNEYFSEMTKIALNHGATIDKYIGDAMMVFFGDPETKGEREDARACVEMALKMQERMGELREKWLHEGFADPFEVRIGINTGYCNVGNFGSEQRLTYTIIGGEVNVAARLESAAQANGILMSYETYAHVQDMVEVEQKEAIKMKGINREIKIYAVEGRKEVVKTKAKPTKAKKPTKKELTKIEQLEKESKQLKESIKFLAERIKKLES